jgi:hypothetical protein
MRFLITICGGIVATPAWQSYGDRRQSIADSDPRLSGLATETADQDFMKIIKLHSLGSTQGDLRRRG